jgi:regulator of sirC expression with transglutaminase-like and TPR domain
MKKRRLSALIDLLDDPDEMVYQTVEKELLKENHLIIPDLEEKWETSFDEIYQERIENLIQDLHFKQTKKQLNLWIKSTDNDLLEGFLVIDGFQYPDVNLLGIHQKIETIKNEIWLEFNNSLTLLEKTTILNHFLFNIQGFSINHNNLNSPQNCFINQLLDTKTGNPVSIGILYTIIARQLGISAQFSDYPKNPLIAIVDRELAKKVHGENTRTSVLFYINPANKGSITSRKEIDYHLKKNKYEPTDYFAEPKNDIYFIKRLAESLLESYQSVGFAEKESKIKELTELFPE